LLVEHGADVSTLGGQYGRAIQAAAYSGQKNINIVQLLLNEGININVQGYYGSIIQAAALKGCENIVQLLLDKGADINAQCELYHNTIQAAAHSGHKKIVQL
ncbi:ankyrin repeat-containing domain protein, partial [Mycena capillaripes]